MLSRNLIAIAVALSLVAGCRPVSKRDPEAAIAEIDEFLARGAVTEAARVVGRTQPSTRGDWMSLIKRAYSIATTVDDFTLLENTSADAHERFPGASEFAAVRTYALLRLGDARKAYSVSREYLTEVRFDNLVDEAWLVNNLLNRSETAEAGELRVSRALPPYDGGLTSDDAEFFYDAAVRLDEIRLMLDSALIYTRNGQIVRARDLAEFFESDYPLPAAYIYYDAEDYNAAERALIRNSKTIEYPDPMDLMFHADVLRAADRAEDSVLIYLDLIQNGRSTSWIPYSNTARWFAASDEQNRARSILDLGIAQFPNVVALRTAAVRLLSDTGDTAGARIALDGLKRQYPGEIELAYLDFELRGSEGSMIRLATAAKGLLYNNPADDGIAMRSAALFARIRSYRDLAMVLDLYESTASVTYWTQFWRGVIATSRDEYNEALHYFETSAELVMSWETAYNLGKVLASLSQYEASREQFWHAAALVEESDIAKRALAALAIAEVYREMGEVGAAVREASYAIDLDKSLTEAYLLIRELEP